MNILFTGGGTGGHVIPAVAMAEELKRRYPEARIGFISRSGGKENDIIRKSDIPLYTLQISGLKRKICKENLRIIKQALEAKRRAGNMIDEFKPDAVIGTGGYVCWPVITAAEERGVPTAIHESNATLGLTTRLLMKKVKLLLLGADIENRVSKGKFVGNPLRAGFSVYTKQRARRELGVKEGARLIVSVGGSIGAERLNQAIFSLIKDFSLKDEGIFHLHGAGHRFFDSIPEKLKGASLEKSGVRIVPFIENMPRALYAADLVISRCGSMTLSELAFVGAPAILIPSPNVTADHQRKNAEYYSSGGAARVIDERSLTDTALAEAVKELIFDSTALSNMSLAMKAMATPNAAKNAIDLVERELLGIKPA